MEVKEYRGVHFAIFLLDIAGLMPSAFSLEGHMEGEGPSKSFFLCVDSGLGENSHFWESHQERLFNGELVLYVPL